jgi:hypothetical protein
LQQNGSKNRTFMFGFCVFERKKEIGRDRSTRRI